MLETRSHLRDELMRRLSRWRSCRAHCSGVGLGVGVGDLLISAIGTGPWQIALVVALAMSVAVLLDGGAVITGQAAVSAILVATLCLPGATSGVNRLVDGLIGGATGLLVVGLCR